MAYSMATITVLLRTALTQKKDKERPSARVNHPRPAIAPKSKEDSS
jgi:hypothetical protein